MSRVVGVRRAVQIPLYLRSETVASLYQALYQDGYSDPRGVVFIPGGHHPATEFRSLLQEGGDASCIALRQIACRPSLKHDGHPPTRHGQSKFHARTKPAKRRCIAAVEAAYRQRHLATAPRRGLPLSEQAGQIFPEGHGFPPCAFPAFCFRSETNHVLWATGGAPQPLPARGASQRGRL